jgi:hypothetical protein
MGGYTFKEYNGNRFWYLNDILHRTDGPAIEYADGHKAWYLNGKLHREDGPAREYSNGTKVWCVNGQLHREDGPAVVRVTGTKEWYLNNARLSEEEFTKKVKKKKFTATEVKSLKSYGIEVDI